MLDKIIFACLLVLVFFIPFEFDFRTVGANPPLVNTDLKLLAAIVFSLWVVKKIRDRELVSPPLAVPLLVYLTCNIMSSVFALIEPVSGFNSVFKLSGGMLLYYVVLDTVRRKEQTTKIINTLLVSGLIVAAIGFFERIFVDFAYEYSPFWFFSPDRIFLHGKIGLVRITSTFVYPNILAMFLEITIFLALGLYLFECPGKKKYFYFTSILVLVQALVMTYSRAAIISLFAGLLLAAAICAKSARLRAKLKAVALIVAAVFLLVAANMAGDYSVKKRVINAPDGNINSNGHRAYIWNSALRSFARNPVLGIGPNNFRWLYAAQYSSKSPYLKWNYPGYIPGIDANSLYLETLVSLGVVGFAAFIYLVISILRYLLGNLRLNDDYQACLALGALGAFSSYLIHGVFDHFGSYQSIIFAFWLALALGVKTRELNARE